MKRTLCVAALVLSAELTMSQAKDFTLDIGAGVGYLAYSHDEQSENSNDLSDLRATYQYWGANVFMDLSKYLTLYSGVWMGLPGTHATAVGSSSGVAINIDKTYSNSLIELEIAAVLKYPIPTTLGVTVSPKVGLRGMFYLAGQSGTTAPNAATKQATSPVSVVTGADVDYLLASGVLLRLPVDVGWGLNSRTNSAQGRYVSTSSVSVRAGLSVGYRL